MKTDEQLERLAEDSMNLNLDEEDDRREFFRLIADLPRPDVRRLAAIHKRRALDATLGR